MYTYKLEKKPNSQVEIVVDIPKKTIGDSYHKAFDELRKDFATDGFRKGAVPKKIAEQKIDKEKIYNKLVQDLLSQIYREILTKENLQPIINPKIDLVKAKEDEDWQIKFQIAQKPTVNLGDYKKMIVELNKEQKKTDIWVPGKIKEKKDEKNKETERLKQLNKIFQLLLKETQCQLPDLLLNEELNQKLSRLVDELQKLGLTLENYLKSKNITIEQLKENYKKEIDETYRLEFILNEIAEVEKIVVEPEEINQIFSKITDEKEKQIAQENIYYYASILRKQKTLDFLLSL
jgi:trigger factor